MDDLRYLLFKLETDYISHSTDQTSVATLLMKLDHIPVFAESSKGFFSYYFTRTQIDVYKKDILNLLSISSDEIIGLTVTYITQLLLSNTIKEKHAFHIGYILYAHAKKERYDPNEKPLQFIYIKHNGLLSTLGRIHTHFIYRHQLRDYINSSSAYKEIEHDFTTAPPPL